MIIFSKTKIMIVPDFGVRAEDGAMASLKAAIEARGDYDVKVVDLQALASGEHQGEELDDQQTVERAAQKLEQLSECDGLVWDGSNGLAVVKTRTIKLKLKNKRGPGRKLELVREPEPATSDPAPAPFDKERIDDILRISDECTDWEMGAPDAIVLLGKSAMLASGINRRDVLCIPAFSLGTEEEIAEFIHQIENKLTAKSDE